MNPLPVIIPPRITELRRKMQALQAQLARIEGKAVRIDCPKVAAIAERVAQETGVPVPFIFGTSRRQQEAHARQRVYFYAAQAGLSLPHIGRAMGRDHTTVLHGIRAEQARRAQ